MPMNFTLDQNGTKYCVDTDKAISLAIELDFGGSQANHFGAPLASTSPWKTAGFIGDTRQGGSCNVDQVSLIPHCNGTHTETVGHIVDQDIWISQIPIPAAMLACLITVEPIAASDAQGPSQTYRPILEPSDRLITGPMVRWAIEQSCQSFEHPVEALIIRTLPNDIEKKSRQYDQQNQPAFFSVQAIETINELGIKHLLVDLPSIDRMHDDGLLTNHHLYWNVPEQSHELTKDVWREKTITEMIFVDSAAGDGMYLLNLQLPAMTTDAVVSRPVIFPLQLI